MSLTFASFTNVWRLYEEFSTFSTYVSPVLYVTPSIGYDTKSFLLSSDIVVAVYIYETVYVSI